MQIISATDNENNRWKKKAIKNKDRKELRIDTSYSKSVRAKWLFYESYYDDKFRQCS